MTKQSAEPEIHISTVKGLEDMKEPRRVKVVIRKYEAGDHDKVCRLFYSGQMENWISAYKRTITLKAPIPTVIQLLLISILYQSFSFLYFLLVEFFVQALFMFIYFYHYWLYAW